MKAPKKSKNHAAMLDPMKRAAWFEVTDIAQANDVKKVAGERVFFRGKINGLTIVSVPEETPPEVAQKIGESLANVGVTAIVVPMYLNFMRLQRLTPAAERFLDAHTKSTPAGSTIVRVPRLSGDGPLDGSDGGRLGEPLGVGAAPGDDQDVGEAEQRAEDQVHDESAG